MSLAQHVTQVEGFDYEGPANPAYEEPKYTDTSKLDEQCSALAAPSPRLAPLDGKSEWRQINFALGETEHEEPHIAAYKVSDARRYLQVATGVIACWLASGIVFGFAALKPVLITEGVYGELCEADTAEDSAVPCAEQDLRLNLFFIAASITSNVSSLLAGAALDRFGRRLCWLIACVGLTIGSLLMGSSFAIPEFDGYLLGNVCLALGGTFLFVPSFQLANAFPKYSGVIVALITGAFDASAAVFLFFRLIHGATGGAITLSAFFFGYVLVPVLILVAELAYMPSRGYHTMLELDHELERAKDQTRDIHDSDGDISDNEELTRVQSARHERRIATLDRIEGLAGDEDHREERVRTEEERHEASGVWGVLHGVSAPKQMLTPWFVLLLVMVLLQMLKMNYFIATVRAQYRYMLGSDDLAEVINHFFDAALPIGGVAATPLIGLLLNNVSVPTTFGVLTGFIIAIGALNCLPYLWAGYATIVVFVAFRPLFYSAISDYVTKVFGFATFGRIYGTIVCISGLLNLGQSGLDALTHGLLGGNATPVNIGLGVGGAVSGLALTMFISVRARVYIEEKEEVEVEHERSKLLGEVSQQYKYGSV